MPTKRTRARTVFIVTVFETGALAGILVALFIVPRSTAMSTFAIISGSVFVLGNILLARGLRQQQPEMVTSVQRKQQMLRLYVVTGLCLLSMLWLYLSDKVHLPF
jgi:predicted transporter